MLALVVSAVRLFFSGVCLETNIIMVCCRSDTFYWGGNFGVMLRPRQVPNSFTTFDGQSHFVQFPGPSPQLFDAATVQQFFNPQSLFLMVPDYNLLSIIISGHPLVGELNGLFLGWDQWNFSPIINNFLLCTLLYLAIFPEKKYRIYLPRRYWDSILKKISLMMNG